ncbi:unnamed protein product, partial [Heterosigma akashiwo]
MVLLPAHFCLVLVFIFLVVSSHAFLARNTLQAREYKCTSSLKMTTNTDLGLTTGLQKIVDGFQALPSDQMRYKQILFMASKAPELEKERWTAESKVQGCLSTVHVHASKRDGKIFYEGDSDGLLTKGLVTILVKGLSGNTPGDIQKVKPEFIKTVGGVSLTPGRNNGFMNMLAMMKRLASSLADGEDGG